MTADKQSSSGKRHRQYYTKSVPMHIQKDADLLKAIENDDGSLTDLLRRLLKNITEF